MTPAQAIERLNAAGMTEVAIGNAVGARQSTINRIRHGRDPHWTLGNAIVLLASAKRRRNRKS